MEQYVTPLKDDLKTLRTCLDNYTATQIYIRDCGGYEPDGHYRMKGKQKLCIKLQDKTLDFKKNKRGLSFLVDYKEVFRFPFKVSGTKNGFLVAYSRYWGSRERVFYQGGDPYNPQLPEPESSILRTIWDDDLLEILFEGRIHLAFHSWMREPDWKYWKVVAPK